MLLNNLTLFPDPPRFSGIRTSRCRGFQTAKVLQLFGIGLIIEQRSLRGFVGCRFAFHGDDDKLASWSENVSRPFCG
jgi:hypothetical protein